VQGVGNTPVPGLADLLNKQGYVAVPLERLEPGYVGVRVQVAGKELFLVVDTGAPNSTLDRYRVRHLDLKWDDYAQCDLDGIDIGGVKTGPLKVDAHDMTDMNRALRAFDYPRFDGLLGADALRPLSAAIGHGGAVLYLRKQESKK
jgi:hypothetical protein